MPPQQNKREESAVANADSKSVSLSYEEYEGLIPHPRLMEQWNKLIPGSAEKIFNRFEKQSDHRMNIEEYATSAK